MTKKIPDPVPEYIDVPKLVGWWIVCRECGTRTLARRRDAKACGQICRTRKYLRLKKERLDFLEKNLLEKNLVAK